MSSEVSSNIILGRFQLQHEISRGAMGIVYKGLDITLEREVALKKMMLNPILNREEQIVQLKRFINEAKAVAKLNHPNILTVLDAGEYEGDYYIVMEYLEGKDLGEYLNEGTGFTLTDSINIIIQAAMGLGFAHQYGIIHRDVKPGNIMILNDGSVKVMDFGIAKVVGNKTLTGADMAIGTIGYMSPEQCEDSSNIDARSDIFSLCVILYQLITGQKPFPGDTFTGFISKLISDAYIPPPVTGYNPDIPANLEKVINNGIIRNREYRYRTADELIADLRKVLYEIKTGNQADIPLRAAPTTGGSSSMNYPATGSAARAPVVIAPGYSAPIPSTAVPIKKETEGKPLKGRKEKQGLALYSIIGILALGLILLVVFWNHLYPPPPPPHVPGPPPPTTMETSHAPPSIIGKTTVIVPAGIDAQGIRFFREGKQEPVYELGQGQLKNIEVKFELEPGNYIARIEKAQFRPVELKLELKAGIPCQLEKSYEWVRNPRITIKTNVQSKLSIHRIKTVDGNSVKEPFREISESKKEHIIDDLPAGFYKIEATASNYEGDSTKIAVGSDMGDREVEMRLRFIEPLREIYTGRELIDSVKEGNTAKTKAILELKPSLANCRDDGWLDSDYKNMTPMHWAARERNSNAANILLHYGANVNITDDYNWTPIYYAAYKKDCCMAKLLITKGANVNIAVTKGSKKGCTPLHQAAICCDLEMAKLLVEKGANKYARDGKGRTPLDIAREKNYAPLIAFLKD